MWVERGPGLFGGGVGVGVRVRVRVRVLRVREKGDIVLKLNLSLLYGLN